jgi:hypothetical protein
LFIQPLTEITNPAPVIPAMTSGTPHAKWTRGGRRSQP